EEAGVTPPTTMDELAAAIPKLTKKDASGKITQLGLGSANDSTTLTTLGYAFGGSWEEEAGVTPPTTMDELAAAIPKLTKKDASGKITQL
ncbi:hypothetical protein CTI14_64915, partial [Methylobacterium radiotolerans]